MKLVIVESPNKTHTIGQFLGSEYKVMASVGHVRDLATTGKNGFGVDIEHGFKPVYRILPDKVKIIRELKSECKKASEIYLATDPDREGEAIAWHLAEVLGLDVNTAKRLTFNAITKTEVLKAMENPGKINMDLVASQETRRIIDRIIGFDLSKLMQAKIKTKSAGRVQSVTLRMIVEHQKEIDAFKSKDYYDIKGIFGECKLQANLYSYNDSVFKPYSIDTEEKYNKIVSELGKTFKVEPLSLNTRASQPKPPFTTSSLEQEAYSRFGYGVKMTSSLAQRLFEGIQINGEFRALITYIRTDSTRLAPEFIEVANQYILNKYGQDALSGHQVKAKKQSDLIQDGHEAIRPIDLSFTPSMAKQVMPNNMYNIYRLIYARAIASLMVEKKEAVTSLKLTSNGYVFKTEANKIIDKGFTKIYEDCGFSIEKSSKELPEEIINASKNNLDVPLYKLDVNKKSTQPPAKYNDGMIVKMMEEKGIGRPSTYSSTISTLVDRDYVESEKHVLTPTKDGFLVVDNLVKYFPNLMDYNYTKQMESSLEEIKEGGTSKVDLLTDFYTKFTAELDDAKQKMEKIKDEPTGELCPICSSPLVYKKSKYGRFIACSNYPACTYIKKEEKPEEFVENRVCPECGGKLVYRVSRKGERFIACSNFPKCKYTESLNPKDSDKKGENPLDKYDLSLENSICPKCGVGHMVLKRSKYGPFLACSNYPKCKNAIKLKLKEDNKKDEEKN